MFGIAGSLLIRGLKNTLMRSTAMDYRSLFKLETTPMSRNQCWPRSTKGFKYNNDSWSKETSYKCQITYRNLSMRRCPSLKRPCVRWGTTSMIRRCSPSQLCTMGLTCPRTAKRGTSQTSTRIRASIALKEDELTQTSTITGLQTPLCPQTVTLRNSWTKFRARSSSSQRSTSQHR